MMRWSNGTIGRTASVIGVALAYGVTGCSGSSDEPPANRLGRGGVPATPGAGGARGVATGTGATATTAPTGNGGATTTGTGTTPVTGAGGVPPIVGAGGTPIVGAGGATIVGAGGTTTSGGGTNAAGGAPAGGAGGDSSQGCGQGTFCMAGDDLAPPDQADGFQLVSPAMTLNPGDEQFWCYYSGIPGTGEVDVGGFRSWMTVGNSHHFITFHSASPPPSAPANFVSCPFGSGDWVYATSKAGMVIGMDLPQNVGLPFQGGSSLIMNMHVINTGTSVAHPVIKLNVLYAKNVMQKAGSVFSLASNAQINVPPGGTQTVRGTCTAAPGSNFFLWTTHSHKFTTEDDVNYVSGGQTTNIVKTTDWENPGTHVWTAPNFLTTKAGDSFTYSCSYKNTLPTALTFGETAAYNEMCLAIGYYFPAGGASCL